MLEAFKQMKILNWIVVVLVCVLSLSNAGVVPILYRLSHQQGIHLPDFICFKYLLVLLTSPALCLVRTSVRDDSIKLGLPDLLCAAIVGIFRKEKWSWIKMVGYLIASIVSALFLSRNKGPLIDQSKSTFPGLLIASLICIARSTNIAACLTTSLEEKMSPKFAHTPEFECVKNLFAALASVIFYLGSWYHTKDYYTQPASHTKLVLIFCNFCGVFSSVLATLGLRWCEQRKGESFVAAFSYLPLLIDTLAVPLVFTANIELGSWGSFISLIIGLFPSFWDKIKEAANADANASTTVANDDNPQRDNIEHLPSEQRQIITSSDRGIEMGDIGETTFAITINDGEEVSMHLNGPLERNNAENVDATTSIIVVDDEHQERDNTTHLGSEQLQGDSFTIATTSDDQGIEMSDICEITFETTTTNSEEVPLHLIGPLKRSHDENVDAVASITIVDDENQERDKTAYLRSEQLQGDSLATTSNDQGIEMTITNGEEVLAYLSGPLERSNDENVDASTSITVVDDEPEERDNTAHIGSEKRQGNSLDNATISYDRGIETSNNGDTYEIAIHAYEEVLENLNGPLKRNNVDNDEGIEDEVYDNHRGHHGTKSSEIARMNDDEEEEELRI